MKIPLSTLADETVLNVDLVAEILDVAPKTVRKWFRENKLPSCNPGGHHRVKAKDLKKFLINKPKRTRVSSYSKSELPLSYKDWAGKSALTGESLGTNVFDGILDFKFYKTSEIARILGVSTATVRLYVSQGKLKSLNSAGHHIVQGKDLKQFMYQRLRV